MFRCKFPFLFAKKFRTRISEKPKFESAGDIVGALTQIIEINNVSGAVAAVDKAKAENSPLYWMLYKIVNK